MAKRYDWSDPTLVRRMRAMFGAEPVDAHDYKGDDAPTWGDRLLTLFVFAMMAFGVYIVAMGLIGG